MELKKFKEYRTTSELYESSGDTKVEVKKTAGFFVVCINGLEVEYFKTKDAADEAAKDAIEAMENE